MIVVKNDQLEVKSLNKRWRHPHRLGRFEPPPCDMWKVFSTWTARIPLSVTPKGSCLVGFLVSHFLVFRTAVWVSDTTMQQATYTHTHTHTHTGKRINNRYRP